MLFGFARDLLRLRKQLSMRRALVVIGDDESCLPESLVPDTIHFLKRLRVPVLYVKSSPVGDVCAALAERRAWIVTENKAMLQLISDQCGVILLKKGNELDVVTATSIKDHVGVLPCQVPSLLALTEKGARESLLTQKQAVRFLELHGTLETGLEKPEKGDLGQVGRKLIASKDALCERCREFRFRAAPLSGLDGGYTETKFIEGEQSAASVLQEHGFWSLVRLLPLPRQEVVTGVSVAAENSARPDYRAVRTRTDLDELEQMIRSAKVCSVDTETSGKDPRNAVLYGAACSVREKQAVYVPLAQADLDAMSSDEVRTRLAKCFDGGTKFVGHNIKFDYVILRKHGISLPRVHFDTMLAAQECFGDWEFFNLGEVARRVLGRTIKRYSDVVDTEQTFLDVPFKDLVDHACTDADITLRLFRRLSEELRNRQSEETFLKDRMGTLMTLAEMECHGVRIDTKKLEVCTNRLLKAADKLKRLILAEAGCDFDPGSPKATTDTLRNVDLLREWIRPRPLTRSEMEQLAWRHPLVERIVRYRKIRKRLHELGALRNATRRGKVFPLFNQLRVPHMNATSHDPNLDEALRVGAVREVLLSRDWPRPRQALQRLQRITGDEVLHTDLTRCGRSDFRCADQSLDGSEHADALLSIAIGLPDGALSRRFLISPEKAGRIRANLQMRYPALFEWLDRFRREAIAQGYAEYDGRRVYIEGLRSSDIGKRNKATTAAIRWLVRY
jgi:DNA polymerase-1